MYVYYAFLASTVWVMASLRHVFFVSIFLLWAFCDALPPYIPALSAGLQNNRDGCIIQYFSLGFGYAEILGFLSFVHGINLSLRQLKRILQKNGLKRKVMYDLGSVISAIEYEIHRSGGSLGYRQMQLRLRDRLMDSQLTEKQFERVSRY